MAVLTIMLPVEDFFKSANEIGETAFRMSTILKTFVSPSAVLLFVDTFRMRLSSSPTRAKVWASIGPSIGIRTSQTPAPPSRDSIMS